MKNRTSLDSDCCTGREYCCQSTGEQCSDGGDVAGCLSRGGTIQEGRECVEATEADCDAAGGEHHDKKSDCTDKCKPLIHCCRQVCSDGGDVAGCVSRGGTIEDKCVKVTEDECNAAGGTVHVDEAACMNGCGVVWCCGSSGKCEQVPADQCSGSMHATEQECSEVCDCCRCGFGATPVDHSISGTDNPTPQFPNDAGSTHRFNGFERRTVCGSELAGTKIEIEQSANVKGTLSGPVPPFDPDGFGKTVLWGIVSRTEILGFPTGSQNNVNAAVGEFGGNPRSVYTQPSVRQPYQVSIPQKSVVDDVTPVPISVELETYEKVVVDFGEPQVTPRVNAGSECKICFPDAKITSTIRNKLTRDDVVIFDFDRTVTEPLLLSGGGTTLREFCPDEKFELGPLYNLSLTIPNPDHLDDNGNQFITTSSVEYDQKATWDITTNLPPCDANGNPVPTANTSGNPGSQLASMFEGMGFNGLS